MRTSALVALLATTVVGCADGPAYEELDVTCTGKCDGFGSIRSLIADAKKLDVGDLIAVGASYASDALNEQLALGDYGRMASAPTKLYALPEVAANDLTLGSIDALVSGLAARFGDGALTTEVNALRAAHLRASGDRVFGESAFKIAASFNHGWQLGTFGFGESETGAVALGFDAGSELEARVIGAYPSEGAAVLQGPLRALRDVRGFVLPRSGADLLEMDAGESFALSGRGRIGLNVGAGVPILIAEPTSFLTYNLVLSAGLRTALEGQMDIQLVRMRDAEVVIDVGMQAANVHAAHIALRDGWGVTGLIEANVSIAGIDVDLGRLVEKAIESRLNANLNLLEAEASRTAKKVRLSVARLRFDLDAADPTGGRDVALAQALRGDVRLAQALAARGDSGVLAEFDLVRSGVSVVSHAGLELLGMHFFTTLAQREGQAVVQTPGGALSLLFDSLHKVAGWFFSSHGYTRTSLAGLLFDGGTGAASSETNLFVQVEEGDEFMERDKVLDHLDPLLLTLAGPAALDAMEVPGNRLEALILERCPLPPDEESTSFSEACNLDKLRNDPEVIRLRAEATAALEANIGHLSGSTRDLVVKLGQLRVAAQSVQDPPGGNMGGSPSSSIVVGLRLDDGALREIMTSRDGRAVENAVVAMMERIGPDRLSDDLADDRREAADDSRGAARAMAEAFDRRRDEYQRLLAVEGATIEGLGMIGPSAIEVRFPVDGAMRPRYEEAVSRSVAHARSQVASRLFADLVDRADDLPTFSGPHAEQAAAYALLALTPPERLDLRVDFKSDNSGCTAFCFPMERYDVAGYTSADVITRGASVSRIASGLFDIDSLTNLDL